MNARLTKELRPLLLPWGIAAVGAAGHFVAFGSPVFSQGEFGSFLVGLAATAFVTGVLVLAALPMGSELQEGTLVMVLGQPVERTRLWMEKLRAATLGIVALALVHGAVALATGHLAKSEAILGATLVVTAICSVGYYTLATGSVLVGIAVAATMPFGIALGIHLLIYYVFGLRPELSDQETVALIVVGSAAYSVFLLWFGRRQFVQFEFKHATAQRGAQVPEELVPRKLSGLFHARPTGVTANLIRKEVCLQKPVFLVSAIFTVCWLLSLGLMILNPAWHDNCVAVLHGLTGTQVVLMVILTGCVSLGDDKALGTAALHLTFPISARRQWLIKLLVATGTGIAMAGVLPILLAALTLFKARVGLLAVQLHGAMGSVMPAVLVFVLSFWSASMVTNTVRAVLTMLLTSFALGTMAMFGVWSAGEIGGLQTGVLTWLIARNQWLPYSLDGVIPVAGILFCLITAGILCALVQSFRQFRRARSDNATFFRYAAILASVAFAIAFWITDVNVSMKQIAGSPLVAEVATALRSVMDRESDLSEKGTRNLTLNDLEITELSGNTKRWLRNSTIEVNWTRLLRAVPKGWNQSRQSTLERFYFAQIRFRNGVTVPITWSAPVTSTRSKE